MKIHITNNNHGQKVSYCGKDVSNLSLLINENYVTDYINGYWEDKIKLCYVCKRALKNYIKSRLGPVLVK